MLRGKLLPWNLSLVKQSLMLIAQVVFLLERGHTDPQLNIHVGNKND